jgi:hypothetical protein
MRATIPFAVKITLPILAVPAVLSVIPELILIDILAVPLCTTVITEPLLKFPPVVDPSAGIVIDAELPV